MDPKSCNHHIIYHTAPKPSVGFQMIHGCGSSRVEGPGWNFMRAWDFRGKVVDYFCGWHVWEIFQQLDFFGWFNFFMFFQSKKIRLLMICVFGAFFCWCLFYSTRSSSRPFKSCWHVVSSSPMRTDRFSGALNVGAVLQTRVYKFCSCMHIHVYIKNYMYMYICIIMNNYEYIYICIHMYICTYMYVLYTHI